MLGIIVILTAASVAMSLHAAIYEQPLILLAAIAYLGFALFIYYTGKEPTR